MLACAGLAGFWLNRDAPRTELGVQQRELLGVAEDARVIANFVVAGRDILIGEGHAEPIYGAGGEIVGWRSDAPTSVRGTNTDTILYVSVVDSDVTMIAIPRDLFIGDGTRRINGVLARQGPDGLMEALESVLGVPIDYYAILDLEIFQDVVDALGGVEVNVPERMYYRDVAGGLTIDFQPGPQVLDGQAASEFLRYRQFRRGDIDRIENVKRLAYAMAAKLQQLHVRAVGILPELVSTYVDRVETNVSLGLIRELLPHARGLELRAATLPTVEVERSGAQGLIADPRTVETFLADTFGGTARSFAGAPDATLLISDRSGEEGTGAWYRDRLIGLGVPEDRISLREASFEPGSTRILATVPHWSDADYYTSLLGAGKQQVDTLERHDGREVDLELILGSDAVQRTPIGAARALYRPTPVPDDATASDPLAVPTGPATPSRED
ncbi:MAG: LCP family protein [Trueperaceae bacterium]